MVNVIQMYKIILFSLLALTVVTPGFSQQEPPVLDEGFGFKQIVHASDSFYIGGYKQLPDGGFYMASGDALTRLKPDGSAMWSFPFAAGLFQSEGLAIDGSSNAYVAVTDMVNRVAMVLKYNPAGSLVKTYSAPFPAAASPAAFGIAGNTGSGRIYVAVEYYNSVSRFYEVAIQKLDTELNLLKTVVVPNPAAGGGPPMPGGNHIFGGGMDIDAKENLYFIRSHMFPRYPIGSKYDSELNLLWKVTLNIEPILFSVIANPSGGIYISWFYPSQPLPAVGVMRISEDGSVVWESTIPDEVWNNNGAVDSAGNFYLQGSGFGGDFQPWLGKLNYLDGSLLWNVGIPDMDIDPFYVDSHNRIYVLSDGLFGVPDSEPFLARYLQEKDTIPPAEISDLNVTAVSSGSITLTWTASGDDGNKETAKVYDIRYSAVWPLNSEAAFGAATQVAGAPQPQLAGSTETFVVGGLAAGTTYYFGIKTADEAGNGSGLSNSPKGITTAVPTEKYEISLSTGDWQIVTISTWSAPLVSFVKIFGTTNPAREIGVSFIVSTYPAGAEGYDLTILSTNTNSHGFAETQLKLGNIPAEYGVTATCASCEASSATVTFTCCGKLPNDDFKQYDVRWATHPYNTQTPTYTKTLQRAGCAVSVLSTLINHYAETFPELNIPTTTPKALNDVAENQLVPKGFDKRHDLNFLVIESTNVSNAKINFVNDSPYTVSEYTIAGLRNLIDSDLKNKLPVIAAVKRTKNDKVWKHFVVIIGKCGNKYIVSDPGNLIGTFFIPEDAITLNDNSTFGPLNDIRRFKKK